MRTVKLSETQVMMLEKAIRWYISDAQREKAPQIEIDAFKKLKEKFI